MYSALEAYPMLEGTKRDTKKSTEINGPIIQTSLDGDSVERAGGYLGEQYGARVIPIHQFDFLTTKPYEVRFTFWGHGTPNTFAGLTPEEFANGLIKHNLLNKIPKVEVIDLVGCEIGLVTDRNSYVRQVAACLYKAGYTGRINAFTNLSSLSTTIVSSMMIGLKTRTVAELFPTWILQGVPIQHKKKYEAEMKQFEPRVAQVHEIEKKVDVLENQIKALQAMRAKIPTGDKSLSTDVIKKNKAEIKSLEKKISELMDESSRLERMYLELSSKVRQDMVVVFDRYAINYDSTRNVRAKLDRNRNFQLTPETFKELCILSDARLEAMQIINNLLSKYAKKINKAETSLFKKTRELAKDLRLEEGHLEVLLSNIRDPSVNRINLVNYIDELIKNEKLAALIPDLSRIRDFIGNEKKQEDQHEARAFSDIVSKLKIPASRVQANLRVSSSLLDPERDKEKKVTATLTARADVVGAHSAEVKTKDKSKEEKDDVSEPDPRQRPG